MSQSPEGSAPDFDGLALLSSWRYGDSIPRRVGAWFRQCIIPSLAQPNHMSQSPEGSTPGFDVDPGALLPRGFLVSIPRRGGAWFRHNCPSATFTTQAVTVSIPRRGGAWFRPCRTLPQWSEYCLNPPKGAAPGFDREVVRLIEQLLLMSQSPEGAAPGFDVIFVLFALLCLGVASQSPEGAAPGFDPSWTTPPTSTTCLNPPMGRRLISTRPASCPSRGRCLNPPKGRRLISTSCGVWRAASTRLSQSPEGAAPGFDAPTTWWAAALLVSQSPKGRRLVSTGRTAHLVDGFRCVSIPRRGGAWVRRELILAACNAPVECLNPPKGRRLIPTSSDGAG